MRLQAVRQNSGWGLFRSSDGRSGAGRGRTPTVGTRATLGRDGATKPERDSLAELSDRAVSLASRIRCQ